MLPTRDMSSPKPLLHVPYGYVMAVEFSLPVIALSLCATLGYYLHFEGVTATHCMVPNFVPSISAVVGDYAPERYIWRLCMAFFSFPRVFDAFLLYGFFSHSPANEKIWYRSLNKLTFFLHFWQYLSLFGLTYISSRENFILHRNCFISFIICSIAHMLVLLLVFRTGRQPFTDEDQFSFRLRSTFAFLHILIFLMSLYFYWRHNTYCEPYVYSFYGICEYLVVLTNIAFHSVQGYDFGSQYHISITPPSRLKHN